MKRKIKKETLLSKLKMALLVKQDGVCPLCGQLIDPSMEEAERDHIVPKSMGGEDTRKNTMLLHKTCHKKKTAWDRKQLAYKRKLEKETKASVK